MLENCEVGKLEEIANLINTQDNRITQDPLFTVERLVRDYGYCAEWADDYVWRSSELNEDEEPSDETLEILESTNTFSSREVFDEFIVAYEDWYKVYYKERWEFVTVFFTEKACLEYIESRKNRGEEMRSYAISCYDNYEMRLIRKLLGRSDESINN